MVRTTQQKIYLDKFKVRGLARRRGYISDKQLGEKLGYCRNSILYRWRNGWEKDDATDLARILCVAENPTDEQLFSVVLKLMDDYRC